MCAAPAIVAVALPAHADEFPTGRAELFGLVRQARVQLDAVPALIEARKWDTIRAILITPPLSDCWTKNAKLLRRYAEAIGETPTGDELAALDAREEAVSHLRFLDMAVYNNVFSPAGGDAKVSASKELVKQYFELPRDEYAASTEALDMLLMLGLEAK